MFTDILLAFLAVPGSMTVLVGGIYLGVRNVEGSPVKSERGPR